MVMRKGLRNDENLVSLKRRIVRLQLRYRILEVVRVRPARCIASL